MHYLIGAYLGKENFESYLLELSTENDLPLVTAIQRLKDAFFNLELAKEALAKTNGILSSDSNPFLSLIFLEFRAKLSIAMGQITEASEIILLLKNKITNQMPLEFQIIPRTCEICQYFKDGAIKQAEILLEECLHLLPLESEHRQYLFLEHALILSLDSRLKKVKDIVEKINKQSNHNSLQSFSAIVLFIDSVHRCDLVLSSQLEKDIDRFSDFYQLYQKEINDAIQLNLVLKYNHGEMNEDEFLIIINLNSISKLYFYLIKRNPEVAKKALQLRGFQPIEYFKTHNSFAYLPIGIALSCGEFEVGKDLLTEKIKFENGHFFDDFYLARAEYLNKNIEKALLHFKLVYENCLMNDCLARLEFEMDVSCELKNRDCQVFWNYAKKVVNINALKFPEIEEKMLFHHGMLGDSPELMAVYEDIKKYGPLDLPVLIIGETGTGKELTAQALHMESPRRNKPFLAINCGAISESLLHSELFGYEQGAFTGAGKHKIGILEAAGDGTVFLDEIGEVSPAIQVALLRVLENNEIRPVGGTKSKKLNFRIIAATNAPLQELVEKNKFRIDLLYRLQRFQISLPPLRKRKSDIKSIAYYYLTKEKKNKDITLSDSFIKAIESYQWPGNIRELKNEMERLILLNVYKNNFTEKDLPQGKFQSIISSPLMLEKSNEISETMPAPSLNEKYLPENNDSRNSAEVNEEEFQNFLNSRNSLVRRKMKLIKLFEKYQSLSRSEVARVMNLALNTAAKDLNNLEKEGIIERIQPTSSPRTHYFTLIRK